MTRCLMQHHRPTAAKATQRKTSPVNFALIVTMDAVTPARTAWPGEADGGDHRRDRDGEEREHDAVEHETGQFTDDRGIEGDEAHEGKCGCAAQAGFQQSREGGEGHGRQRDPGHAFAQFDVACGPVDGRGRVPRPLWIVADPLLHILGEGVHGVGQGVPVGGDVDDAGLVIPLAVP